MTRKRHDNPNRAEHNRKADPERAEKRLNARIKFLKQIEKETAVGIDPIYDHCRGRHDTTRFEESSDWKKISKEYDRENA
jgi:hypothetical protein